MNYVRQCERNFLTSNFFDDLISLYPTTLSCNVSTPEQIRLWRVLQKHLPRVLVPKTILIASHNFFSFIWTFQRTEINRKLIARSRKKILYMYTHTLLPWWRSHPLYRSQFICDLPLKKHAHKKKILHTFPVGTRRARRCMHFENNPRQAYTTTTITILSRAVNLIVFQPDAEGFVFT